MDAQTLAFRNEILRGTVGSTAHGTAIEGKEDRDEMGICIEPPSYVCGLNSFEHYTFRTQPEGVRSGPGDLDLIIYSLRKFCTLAAQGNPHVLMLLWLPSYLKKTTAGMRLIEIREAFISKDAGMRYLGYLISQRMGMTGEKGKKVARPDLVAKFGYDTKYAMHALRLGLQGIEYLTEGRISVPIKEPTLGILRDIKQGKVPLADVLNLIANTETRLRKVTAHCTKVINRDLINNYLVEEYQHHWTIAKIRKEKI